MTLPLSGPLSADDINAELMAPPLSTTALNDPPVRVLFTRPITESEISYDHGHGKFISMYIPYVPPSGGAYGLNLRQMAIEGGWNQNAYVEVTISASTVILSNSTSIPALTIDGAFPNGAKLINNGIIMGRGGNGGQGGNGSWGAAGGPGVNVSTPIIIENNGTIGGGGGGGGGGGSGEGSAHGHGGGGGGGASYGAGAWVGGAGGSLYGGGGGGGHVGGRGKFSSSGAGGSGGNIGAVGHGGSVGQRGQGAGGGGAAGAAINGNAYVTWTALGTTYGSLN
jgi:hypothetical protein